MSGPGRRAPSMYDVAARAGVSHQTVSRVLNGFPGIRATTRDRVLDAIRDLGYRPNVAARALVTSRTRAIGVLALASADFGPTSSLLAVERATRDADYHPLITSTTVDAAAVRESLGFLLDRGVEALIVIAPYRVVLDQLATIDRDLPVVALQTGDVRHVPSVSIDQRAGARLAARHLLDLGHRRIQQLAGPEDFLEAAARRAAVESELAAAGVAVLPPIAGDWTADSGYRAGAAVRPDTTAVICGNDQMALGLIHALADAGRGVPDEVSVVGFDDIPEAAHSLPPLTTVHQDFEEVGRRAVARVLGLLHGMPDGAETEPAGVRLVVRESTRAVM